MAPAPEGPRGRGGWSCRALRDSPRRELANPTPDSGRVQGSGSPRGPRLERAYPLLAELAASGRCHSWLTRFPRLGSGWSFQVVTPWKKRTRPMETIIYLNNLFIL